MLRTRLLLLSLMVLAAALFVPPVAAQGGRTLFGDVRITGEDNNLVPKEAAKPSAQSNQPSRNPADATVGAR